MDIWALIWLWNLYFCVMMLSSLTSFLMVYIYIQVVDDSLHYGVLFASFSYNHFSVIFIDNPNK